MKKYSRRINFKDKRGYILDILYKEDFNRALISSNKILLSNFTIKKQSDYFILNGSCFYFQKLN